MPRKPGQFFKSDLNWYTSKSGVRRARLNVSTTITEEDYDYLEKMASYYGETIHSILSSAIDQGLADRIEAYQSGLADTVDENESRC